MQALVHRWPLWLFVERHWGFDVRTELGVTHETPEIHSSIIIINGFPRCSEITTTIIDSSTGEVKLIISGLWGDARDRFFENRLWNIIFSERT